MTFLFESYLGLNFLCLAGSLISLAIFKLNQKYGFLAFSDELKFNYILLTSVMTVSILQGVLPEKQFFEPAAKIWSASSSAGFEKEYTNSQSSAPISFAGGKPIVKANQIGMISAVLLIGAFLFGLARLLRDLRSLSNLKKNSFLVRKIGKTGIYSNDTAIIPFSFWFPNQSYVIVPSRMFENDWKLAVLHELQHHRQKDTVWVYGLWILKTLCFWNPASYLWNQTVTEVQELACDESLVGRRTISPKAYAGCLIRVAENSVQSDRGFVCATGLVLKVGRHSLTRRIKSMFSEKYKRPSRARVLLLTIFTTLAMVSVAMASQNVIQDRRLTMEQAHKLLSTSGGGSLEIKINDLVLKQLNRYAGTPEGREFMRQSLARMETHKAFIEKKVAEYGVPKEFLAIPIVESGYRNREPNNKQGYGAGMWMFIVQTAKIYGLKVEAGQDERLDIEKATDAAMRYLLANYARFKSWELSVLAYNIGENAVQKGIDKTGSRDVWTLIQSGFENDEDYYPKLMAAVLIMKNPSVIE